MPRPKTRTIITPTLVEAKWGCVVCTALSPQPNHPRFPPCCIYAPPRRVAELQQRFYQLHPTVVRIWLGMVSQWLTCSGFLSRTANTVAHSCASRINMASAVHPSAFPHTFASIDCSSTVAHSGGAARSNVMLTCGFTQWGSFGCDVPQRLPRQHLGSSLQHPVSTAVFSSAAPMFVSVSQAHARANAARQAPSSGSDHDACWRRCRTKLSREGPVRSSSGSDARSPSVTCVTTMSLQGLPVPRHLSSPGHRRMRRQPPQPPLVGSERSERSTAQREVGHATCVVQGGGSPGRSHGEHGSDGARAAGPSDRAGCVLACVLPRFGGVRQQADRQRHRAHATQACESTCNAWNYSRAPALGAVCAAVCGDGDCSTASCSVSSQSCVGECRAEASMSHLPTPCCGMQHDHMVRVVECVSTPDHDHGHDHGHDREVIQAMLALGSAGCFGRF